MRACLMSICMDGLSYSSAHIASRDQAFSKPTLGTVNSLIAAQSDLTKAFV